MKFCFGLNRTDKRQRVFVGRREKSFIRIIFCPKTDEFDSIQRRNLEVDTKESNLYELSRNQVILIKAV